MKIVVALGGNALLDPNKGTNFDNYLQTVRETCKSLAELAEENQLVITHGNGTQVGNLLLQQEAADGLKLPLDVCGAETQGQIGYLLQKELNNRLRKTGKKAVTVVTQVLVDKNDPGFKEPTKPVGLYYSKKEAKKLKKKYTLAKIGDKYRRVVPSPQPLEIVEGEEIKQLVENGNLVISCGGGGIPVIKENGKLKGVEAVIDKDMAAELLAELIQAEIILILTNVKGVYLNYGTDKERLLRNPTLEELKRYHKEGHFPPGSMGPKIQAGINFLEKSRGRKVIIASIEDLEKAIREEKGTVIRGG